MISLKNEPQLPLIKDGTKLRPAGAADNTKAACLVYHEFFTWCVLTYHGKKIGDGWYARDERIYSEGMIRAAWVLPKASDVLDLKAEVPAKVKPRMTEKIKIRKGAR